MKRSERKVVHFHLIDTNSFIFETYDQFSALNEEVYFIVFGRSNKNFTEKILALDNVILSEDFDANSILDPSDDLKVFFHFLNLNKTKWFNSMFRKHKNELYWVFYGADLHTPLERIKKISYTETETRKGILNSFQQSIKDYLFKIYWRPVSKLIKEINWFCFWNKYEYDLLKQHFETKCNFKYFRYFTGFKEVNIELNQFNNDKKIILINHSGSKTGNHISLIKKLEKLIVNHDDYRLLLPLNYGEVTYIQEIKHLVSNSLFKHYEFLQHRMPKDEYFAKLANATIAVYGYYRQEGAGNINSLLNTRVQIFLSSKNVHRQHLLDVGYKVSELESLSVEKNIHKLTAEDYLHNCQLYNIEFSANEKRKVFSNLVNITT